MQPDHLAKKPSLVWLDFYAPNSFFYLQSLLIYGKVIVESGKRRYVFAARTTEQQFRGFFISPTASSPAASGA